MSQPFILKLQEHCNLRSSVFRRALRMALAMFVGTVIYYYAHLMQGFWVPLTVCIVMQLTTGGTLRKGLQRFVGTILGLLIGFLLVEWIHSLWVIDLLLVVFLTLTYMTKAFNLVNYGIFVVPLSAMVAILVTFFVPHEANSLIVARLYDTTIGAALGVVFTLLIFPTSLKPEIEKNNQHTLQLQQHYLQAILQHLLRHDNSEALLKQSFNQFTTALMENRRLYADWVYEVWFDSERKQTQQKFLKTTEKTGQALFALQELAREGLPDDTASELRDGLVKISEIVSAAAINITELKQAMVDWQQLETQFNPRQNAGLKSLALNLGVYKEINDTSA